MKFFTTIFFFIEHENRDFSRSFKLHPAEVILWFSGWFRFSKSQKKVSFSHKGKKKWRAFPPTAQILLLPLLREQDTRDTAGSKVATSSTESSQLTDWRLFLAWLPKVASSSAPVFHPASPLTTLGKEITRDGRILRLAASCFPLFFPDVMKRERVCAESNEGEREKAPGKLPSRTLRAGSVGGKSWRVELWFWF